MHRPEELSGRYKVHVCIYDAHKKPRQSMPTSVSHFFCPVIVGSRQKREQDIYRCEYLECECWVRVRSS